MKTERLIKAAVFDMDGLLIDSERIALETFVEIGDVYQLDGIEELYRQVIGMNHQAITKIVTEALQERVDPKRFLADWSVSYQGKVAAKPVPVKTGVHEVLGALAHRKIPAAVATSTGTEMATKKLRNSGLLDYFQVLIGGDQVSQSKPSPDIYLRAAESLRVEPAHCLAMEDSPNGVRAAVAAGMQVVQIPDQLQPDADLLLLGHQVFPCIDQVMQLLDG